MPTVTGTANNDLWLLIDPGLWTFNGLGGVDTIDLGTSTRSSYSITLGNDGSIKVDSVSAASGAGSELHLTTRNIEILQFNSRRETLDLRTLFGDITPPTVAITSDTPITAPTRNNVTYTLLFSEAVSAPAATDFAVGNGSVVSVSGSGASYRVVVAPNPNTEAALSFGLKSSAVSDASGNVNAEAHAGAQPIDTLAPRGIGFSPAVQASAVAPGSNLVVTFSEPVRLGQGSVALRDGAGVLVASYSLPGSPELSGAGATLTLNPGADLAFGTTYSLQFAPGAITDLAGNAWAGTAAPGSSLPGATAYTFSTAVNPANPALTGSQGNDHFTAAPGTLRLEGLAGLDSFRMPQPRAAYDVKNASGAFTVEALDHSSTTTLSHVERLQFADQSLALDLDGSAGTVAKILGAVFGPASVANREYAGIGLQLMDGGMGYEALMQLAIDARLGPGAGNAAVVELLYTNVVGQPPSPGERAAFVALLDNHSFTPATLGMLAADHALNLAHIDLVGLAASGLAYLGG